MAPSPVRPVFGEAPPFSIEALRAEVDDLLAWSDQLCVEFPGPKRSRVLVTFFAFPSAKNLIFHQSVTCHNVTS